MGAFPPPRGGAGADPSDSAPLTLAIASESTRGPLVRAFRIWRSWRRFPTFIFSKRRPTRVLFAAGAVAALDAANHLGLQLERAASR